MDERSCYRCEKRLAPGEGGLIPRAVAVPTVVAFAFLHAGMWAVETLRKPFCPRCRAFVTRTASACAALMLGAISYGIACWLTRSWSPWRG